MKFLYTVDPFADEPIMLLNKEIGLDEKGNGIDGALFQQELLQLDTMGKKCIQVWINSPGGNVIDGFSICNAILKSKTPVDTFNGGIAASIAGVIFMTGRKRIMADYASLMIHSPSGGDDKKALDALSTSIVMLLTAKSNVDQEKVQYLMDKTTWLGSSECFEKGFCTEIEVTSESNQKRMPAGNVKAMWTAGNTILNSFLNQDQKNTSMANTMTKITMKLGLNDAATEDNVVMAIKGIEDRAYKAELDLQTYKDDAEKKILNITNSSKKEVDAAKQECDSIKAEMEDLKAKLAAKQKEYDDTKKKLDDMKKEKDDAEEEGKKEKAKNLVEGFAKIGRIKNEPETIQKWTALAVTDFEGTKKMIEELPLNVKAPVISDPVQGQAGEYPTTAISMTVKNRLKRMGKVPV